MERKPYIPEYLDMILEQLTLQNELLKQLIKPQMIMENKENNITEDADNQSTGKKTKKHKS